MDFGRITDTSRVDYTLPPDHKSVKRVLGGIKADEPQVYAGGVLWANPEFVGTIYPKGTRPGDYVRWYAKQFNTIELNATHYRMPELSVIKGWRDAAAKGFKFCPKVHQEISHSEDLMTMIGLHNDHAKRLNALESKLGTSFLQLPPSFSPDRMNELLRFLDKSILKSMAVELRHPAWFSNEAALNTVCNFLYQHQLPLVLTDTPGRRDVLHMRFTTKTLFVRFNANNQPDDKLRIKAWLERAAVWFGQGLETFYFFIHTPKQLTTPVLTAYFAEELYRTCRISIERPVFNEYA